MLRPNVAVGGVLPTQGRCEDLLHRLHLHRAGTIIGGGIRRGAARGIAFYYVRYPCLRGGIPAGANKAYEKRFEAGMGGT